MVERYQLYIAQPQKGTVLKPLIHVKVLYVCHKIYRIYKNFLFLLLLCANRYLLHRPPL